MWISLKGYQQKNAVKKGILEKNQHFTNILLTRLSTSYSHFVDNFVNRIINIYKNYEMLKIYKFYLTLHISMNKIENDVF